MSWKPEVQVTNDDKWYSNGLRFATRDEAYRSARQLFFRWTSCEEFRATECDDPVTDYLDEDGKHHSLSQTTWHTTPTIDPAVENIIAHDKPFAIVPAAKLVDKEEK